MIEVERVSGVLFRSAISGQTHRYARPEDSFPEVNANGRELWGRGKERKKERGAKHWKLMKATFQLVEGRRFIFNCVFFFFFFFFFFCMSHSLTGCDMEFNRK